MLKTKARLLAKDITKRLPASSRFTVYDRIYPIILKDLEISYLLGRTDQVNNVKFEHDSDGHLVAVPLNFE